MKYSIMIAMLLIISLSLYALNIERCITNNERMSVSISNERAVIDLVNENSDLIISNQTFALPYNNAHIVVNDVSWKVYDQSGNFLRNSKAMDTTIAYLSNSFIFREMNGFTVSIKMQLKENDSYKVLEHIDYDVFGTNPCQIPNTVSPAFLNSYRKLASNFETSYLRNLPVSRPKLLLISHTSLNQYIGNFVSWKKARGFEVYTLDKQSLGNTAAAIRDGILAHYLQYQCDYLLLLGDVTGSFAIPTNIYPSPDGTENDADDNFYTMLLGNDYFPEMLSGRFSFGSASEFLILSNKTIMYEKYPYMTNPNWMKRGLVVAGNYAEGGLRPVTPVQMSKWLREKMLAKGYTQVDTVFFPPTLTGASAIQASINQGVQFISYRGWGAADGWHYPAFHNSDLNNSIVNGARMPIVFSIVCNTGDFANSLNPCFGEKWMLMGTISSPNGCVGFVGPSDLHTKTNFNNTISSGIFSSIFDDDERNIGASVLAGKIEFYNNYPLERASNQNVSFYFHVYNILSDPSMNMWVLEPSTIPATVITGGTTFSSSASHIQIQAPNLNGASVTGTRDNTNYTYAVIKDGIAILPINPEQTGNLTVTIFKENFVPLVTTLTPSQPASIGVINNSLAGQLITAGQNYQATLTLKNYTVNALNNITANFSASPTDMVTIQNSSEVISSLAAGATTTVTFNFSVSGNVAPHKVIRFTLSMPNQSTHSMFELLTGGAEFVVVSSQGNLNIGNNNLVSFSIMNTGAFPIQNSEVQIYSRTDAANIITTTASLGSVAVGETKTFQSTIFIQSDCYNGRSIPLTFKIINPGGYETICYYSLTAGNPTNADPTGPDGYGYFAYDSFDIAYPNQRPVYEWVEIDPRDGGNGEVHLIVDDDSYTVDLPFTFRYYGVDYNQMTICSNGWISFVTTWMSDFNNLYIPAALGPYAMVAPYWDDLKGMKVIVQDTTYYFADMRICNWYDQANNRYIVEWNDAYNRYTIDLLQNAHLEKMQVILYPRNNADGNIIFQYHTIDNPALTSNYSTVGIENHLQNDGLIYTFADIYPITATPLQSGLAIKFTTDAPDGYVHNQDNITSVIPFKLLQNYPNPFNLETTIAFDVNKNENVVLDIYNLKGQKVKTLHQGVLKKGSHKLVWNSKDDNDASVSSGIYIYKLSGKGFSQTKKMILMK